MTGLAAASNRISRAIKKAERKIPPAFESVRCKYQSI